jgi:predicted  nucleic acid-binding Zn-ribbon protein
MKRLILIPAIVAALFSLTLVSCSGNEEKPVNREADSLAQVNGKLSGDLNAKDEVIQDFIDQFNDIQADLNAIKEKEKIVSKSASKGDVKNSQDQIKEDIQSIYDLMMKNRQRLGAMSDKLKNSNLKIKGLEQMIENMQTSLNLKDEEIAELRTQIESLNIELSNLNTNYKSLETESNNKTEEMNTAFYAVGTSKELIEKKVISKEGGVLGIGKSTKVSQDFNREYFTKINIEKTTSIDLGVKKMKMLTTHPSNSYKIVGTKPIEKIEITNAKEFWSASKFLVIVVE